MSEGVRQRAAGPKLASGSIKPNSGADTKTEMARQGKHFYYRFMNPNYHFLNSHVEEVKEVGQSDVPVLRCDWCLRRSLHLYRHLRAPEPEEEFLADACD